MGLTSTLYHGKKGDLKMPSIKYKKKTYAGATFPVLEMTKAEYDALSEAKKMDGTVYMITDDTGGWEAENASYDNTTSGLTATNVQDALDEINSKTLSRVEYTIAFKSSSSTAAVNTGIARSRVVSVIIHKNDDFYYSPIGLSIYDNGTIEARRLFNDTETRSYIIDVWYI